jgi:hypothetical protein
MILFQNFKKLIINIDKLKRIQLIQIRPFQNTTFI